MTCELILPWPPSDNSNKRAGRITRTRAGQYYQPRVNTLETKRYFYEVWLKIRQEGLKSFGNVSLYVEVDAYPPDNKHRDLTNIIKVLNDSLQRGGLFDDDYQICRLLIQRMNIIPEGQVIVRVYPHE